MFGITLPAITSAARTLAGYLAVWLVAKGVVDTGESELLVTVLTGIVGIGASIFFRRKTALVTQTAALDGVSVEVSKAQAPGTAAATADVPGVTVTR